MPGFNYEAKTRDGLIKKGLLVAPNAEAAMQMLRGQQLMPVKVKACRTIIQRTSREPAPRAIRIPISWVLAVTEYESTP